MELDISEQKGKILIAAGIVVAVLVLVLLIMSFTGGPGPVNAYFEKGALGAGESTTLVVEARNTLDSDADTMQVAVEAVDPGTVMIENPSQSSESIGKGEMRRFRFPVSISQEALEGTYSAEVSMTLDGQTRTVRVSLTVTP